MAVVVRFVAFGFLMEDLMFNLWLFLNLRDLRYGRLLLIDGDVAVGGAEDDDGHGGIGGIAFSRIEP